MAHFFLLGPKVFDVIFFSLHFNRYPFHHLQTIPLKPNNLPRIVRHNPDFPEPQLTQDLCTNAIVPKIRLKPKLFISLHGVFSFIL